MRELPANVYSVASVRQFDRCAIEREGIPGYILMSRAGAACYHELLAAWPDVSRLLVVCGAGNNAGDGYVIARLALGDGRLHAVVSLVDTDKLSGDAEKACQEYLAAGGTVLPWDGSLAADADLVVDALLGSGLERNVEGRFADAVSAMNTHPAPVMAVDLPSGLHGDSGAVMGCAVQADATMTFVGLKPGLFLGKGPARVGDLLFDGLGIPDSCYDSHRPYLQRIRSSELERAFAPRSRDSHKGDFGHVLVVGGGPGMPGAARMCAEAALRVGAGRVSVATHPSNVVALLAGRPELMCHGIDDPGQLVDLLDRTDVVAFGPGLGTGDWSRSIYASLCNDDRPAVWDADALNLLADAPFSAANRVITPHPGEGARLAGCDTNSVQADRSEHAAQLQAKFGGVAVLKGAGTLVADGQSLRICDAGNPGMATAGMGDVLTGVIAGLLAQGFPPAEAAALGVLVHATAGDRAAAAGGERGMLAGDLMAQLREVVNP